MLKEEISNSARKIGAMLEMQAALNDAIERAIIDEIGELNHELKSDWCRWKESQKEKNYSKVLEELVDVWHFVLSKHYLPSKENYSFYEVDETDMDIIVILLTGITRARSSELVKTDPIINFLNSEMTLADLVELTFLLDFDIDQVYDAYIEKNKENHERLKRGY